MITAWNGATPPEMPRPNVLQWLRLVVRAVLALVVTLGLMLVVLVLQLVEKLLPVTWSHRARPG